jgi:hypothetical protein
LASTWRIKGLFKEPSESPRAPRLNPFQKLPLTRAEGTELDIEGLLLGTGLAEDAENFRANDIDTPT